VLLKYKEDFLADGEKIFFLRKITKSVDNLRILFYNIVKDF